MLSANPQVKNVWIVNRFATPPDLPGGTRHYDFGVELAKRGHNVTIFAADLNYMLRSQSGEGETHVWPPEPQESYGSIKFIWAKTLKYKRNDWRRAVGMLSFALSVITNGIKRDSPDVVIGSSPHLFGALAGYILAKLRRARFILEVRDLWPQTLIDMRKQNTANRERKFSLGSIFYTVVIITLRIIETLLYRKAERIIVLSEGARQYIIKRGIRPEKLSLLPNGVYLEEFKVSESRTSVREKFGVADKFAVMYTGAHGPANALDTILDTGRLMLDAENVAFVLVGDGPVKAKLLQTVKADNLDNVKMIPAVPKNSVPDMLNAADALVITLRSVELFSYGVSPNKLFEYMASGKPVLCAVSGDVADMVIQAGAGIVIEPENPEALAEAIRSMMADKEKCLKYGENGRLFVEKNFSRSRIVMYLFDILEA